MVTEWHWMVTECLLKCTCHSVDWLVTEMSLTGICQFKLNGGICFVQNSNFSTLTQRYVLTGAKINPTSNRHKNNFPFSLKFWYRKKQALVKYLIFFSHCHAFLMSLWYFLAMLLESLKYLRLKGPVPTSYYM